MPAPNRYGSTLSLDKINFPGPGEMFITYFHITAEATYQQKQSLLFFPPIKYLN